MLFRGGQYVEHLVRIARELPEIPGEPPRLYVVTRNAQTVVAADRPNLEQAGLRGLIRVIGAEHPHLRATQIDLDEDTDAEQLARQLLGGSEEDETAWRNGQWYTARLCPTPLRPEERRTTVVNPERDGMRLQIRTPGDLESMELAAFDRDSAGAGTDRGRGHRVQHQLRRRAGRVRPLPQLRGAPAADRHRLRRRGDRGRARRHRSPGRRPCRRHIRRTAAGARSSPAMRGLAVTLPRGLADDQAAAVTTAHATAWYGLHDLARIDPGDRVLIHSATGGVGQAAIAIARAAGAEIFATAGSQERRELLRDMGIEHVYDSRSIEFAEQIRRDTDGYGVDIVLNSVTGAAQRAGIELLALGGRFVEIGKRDIYGDTRLGLFPFRRNLTFYAVDLGLLSISHPEKVRNLLDTVYRLTADGVLPLPESTHYPLADAATAIRMMGGAQHTGKLVLDIPRTGQRPRGGAPAAGSGLPRRRGLHHHRRPRRPRTVPRREDGQRPVVGASCCPRARSRRSKRWRPSSASARSAPTSWCSAAISPNPARRIDWWQRRPRPGFRCAACCTPRRWSKTPR